MEFLNPIKIIRNPKGNLPQERDEDDILQTAMIEADVWSEGEEVDVPEQFVAVVEKKSRKTSVREAIPPSPCGFPLRGRCRDGCRCSQFHARTVPSGKPCKHFQRGHCKFGLNCKFSHVLGSAESTLSQRKRDEEQECSICFEKMLANNETSDDATTSKFGILQNCNHCFCLSCIRKWRTTEGGTLAMRKTCPVCRTPSDFTVPSEHLVETPEEKKKFIENFKKNLSHVVTLDWAEGFVRTALNAHVYLHALPDGTDVEGNDYD
ncbi:E3 ubiquitin-protein ligase makorin-1 [Elysia marginata]|uniref:RING-type E3 ubiquitin transferase n=1 Tax=Elysia marginata TaxID=1093978 RepID=A0AAV4JGY1_9GAST|nr:E3 ubiquitin-protein ligase makorin-1 [Elysia marginata]